MLNMHKRSQRRPPTMPINVAMNHGSLAMFCWALPAAWGPEDNNIYSTIIINSDFGIFRSSMSWSFPGTACSLTTITAEGDLIWHSVDTPSETKPYWMDHHNRHTKSEPAQIKLWMIGNCFLQTVIFQHLVFEISKVFICHTHRKNHKLPTNNITK